MHGMGVRRAWAGMLALAASLGMAHGAPGALPEAAEHQAGIVADIEAARTMCATAMVDPRALEQMYAGIQLASYRVLDPGDVRAAVLARFRQRLRDPEPREGWCGWAAAAFGPDGTVKRGILQILRPL